MDQLADSTSILGMLHSSQFQLPDEAADTFWQLQRWPLVLQEELDAAAERVRGYREHFQDELLDDQQQLTIDLHQLQVNSAVCCDLDTRDMIVKDTASCCVLGCCRAQAPSCAIPFAVGRAGLHQDGQPAGCGGAPDSCAGL